MKSLAKKLIKLFASAAILILIIEPLVQKHLTRTVKAATEPIIKTTMQNMESLQNQANQLRKNQSESNKPTKQEEKPKGCLNFKEICTCFDKFNNKMQTTELECRQFIKTNF